MNRRLLLLVLPAAALMVGEVADSAVAAGGKVALLPGAVIQGAPGNGKVVTDALKSSLLKQGLTLSSDADVAKAIAGLDMKKPIPIATLASMRAKLGVDYLIYPRILSAGVPLKAGSAFQATVIVNVMGKNAKAFTHTRQVGQEFAGGPDAKSETVVIPKADADTLAGKLLEGFYAKLK